jgi:hypothetical protein
MLDARRLTWRLAVAGALAIGAAAAPATAGRLDDFARCLRDNGTTMYGTFWCPQCEAQRELFGRSERYLRYVECAYEDSDEKTPACRKAGIKSYPTWAFPDGSRLTGRQTLERLARQSGCELPE